MNHAARVMHSHCVGVLIVDEIQNLSHKGTSKATLMSAFVTASNQLGVPYLFRRNRQGGRGAWSELSARTAQRGSRLSGMAALLIERQNQ